MRSVAMLALISAVFVCLMALPGQARAGDVVPRVTGLNHGMHDARLRLIFDVTPEPAFALFTLSDPDRLIIDFLHWTGAPSRRRSRSRICRVSASGCSGVTERVS